MHTADVLCIFILYKFCREDNRDKFPETNVGLMNIYGKQRVNVVGKHSPEKR